MRRTNWKTVDHQRNPVKVRANVAERLPEARPF